MSTLCRIINTVIRSDTLGTTNMIDFKSYLNLFENDTFSKAKSMAINTWVQVNKKNGKTAKDVPDSLKNASNKTELRQALNSWQTSNNNMYKNGFVKIMNVLGTGTDTAKDAEDERNNAEDTAKDVDTNVDDENSNTEDTSNSKESKESKESEDKKIKFKDVSKADSDSLNTSDFVSNYDFKKGQKIKKLDDELSDNEQDLLACQKQIKDKRAQNFKSVIDSLNNIIKLFVPNADIGEIGNKAVEYRQRESKYEEDTKQLDNEVNDMRKNMENDKNTLTKQLEARKKLELKKLEFDDGDYATDLNMKCAREGEELEHATQKYQELKKEKEAYQKEIEKYTDILHLSDEDKKRLDDYKAEIEDIENLMQKASKDVLSAEKAYKNKYNAESEKIKDKIQQYRQARKEKIEKEYNDAYSEMEYKFKQRVSKIEDAKKELVNHMHMLVDYKNADDIPQAHVEKLNALTKKFKDCLSVTQTETNKD